MTPLVKMSEATFNFSFGKFLEITFCNKLAVCHTAGCGHSPQSHTRFFSQGNLVTSIDFKPARPYSLGFDPKLSYNDDSRQSLKQKALDSLARIISTAIKLFLRSMVRPLPLFD